MTLLTDPAIDQPDFHRDGWGHPLIIPPDGGDPTPYIRASTNEVEDRYNLELWARRNVVFGMAHDNSLVARLLAIGGEPSTWDLATRKQVNQIHEDAATIAKSTRRAAIGTAVHRLTERVDRGESVIAGPYGDDLDAYVATVAAAGYSVDQRFIECRLVCDDLLRAGTADRLFLNRQTRRHRIADIKTGETTEYGALGWAAQLACYAHSDLYDVETGDRTPLPSVDRTVGLIIHLPAGEGRCTIYEIDLVAGYRAAVLDNEVRAIRRESKRWITPLSTTAEAEATTSPTPAELSIAKTTHPSAGRREILRQRYRALPVEAQDRFRALLVDADDLDAVEATIDQLETGAVARPAAAAPTRGSAGAAVQAPSSAAAPALGELVDELGRDHDEGQWISDGTYSELRSRHRRLPTDVQMYLATIAAEANRAGVPFYLNHAHSERRYWLYLGLVELGEVGLAQPTEIRMLVAEITGRAIPLDPRVTVGHAVGAMPAAQAFDFAGACAERVDVAVG